MVGGGQLGRMFCFAAQAMGYRVAVLDPDPTSPAGAVADKHLRAAYDDEAALAELAQLCDAVSTEFENVPAASLELLAQCRERTPDVPVVLVTGHGDISMAVQAMRDGAYDFIEKPFAAERLTETVRRALARRAETRAKARFAAGATGVQPWLDEQQRLRDAQSALARNQLGRLNNRMNLYQVLGGAG